MKTFYKIVIALGLLGIAWNILTNFVVLSFLMFLFVVLYNIFNLFTHDDN